jgi:hypothetical protein
MSMAIENIGDSDTRRSVTLTSLRALFEELNERNPAVPVCFSTGLGEGNMRIVERGAYL